MGSYVAGPLKESAEPVLDVAVVVAVGSGPLYFFTSRAARMLPSERWVLARENFVVMLSFRPFPMCVDRGEVLREAS